MSIAKNYSYNVVYQIVTLIIPLLTVPYISRVLGSNGIGINAYTNSIIQYFVLFGTIGISLYGNRTIAYVRNNKEELSRTFWGIFVLKLITTFLAFCIFLVFLLIFNRYEGIFLIQSIYIFAATIDISWLYMGLEDFKKTVLRNLIIKIVGILCIFIFVKSPSDLWKYVFILALSQFLGQLTLWFYIPKTITKVKLMWNDITIHLIPSLSLFIPQIAIQIYVVLNKTMLGSLSNTNEVGYFDNSDKIIKMVLSIVTAMGVVMLPRISNTFAKGDISKVKNYLYQSFEFASYLSFPLMFGIVGIAKEFIPWFFGPGFSKTGTIMSIISPIIVLIAWSNVLGQQYLLPIGKVRGYAVSVCIGALVNFILNVLLIKHFLSIGTAIATFIAEFAVTAVQLYWVRNDVAVRKLFHSTWKYLLSGIVMYCVLRAIGKTQGIGVTTTFIQIFVGVIIYFLLLILLKSEMNQKLFMTGWKKIKKKIFSV